VGHPANENLQGKKNCCFDLTPRRRMEVEKEERVSEAGKRGKVSTTTTGGGVLHLPSGEEKERGKSRQKEKGGIKSSGL